MHQQPEQLGRSLGELQSVEVADAGRPWAGWARRRFTRSMTWPMYRSSGREAPPGSAFGYGVGHQGGAQFRDAQDDVGHPDMVSEPEQPW